MYPQKDETINYLQGIADKLHDSDIFQKLKNQAVAYHKHCYATYNTNAKRFTDEPADSSWQQYRQLHKLAFESLCNFIDSEIMKNNHVMYFAQLFNRYQALLLEFGENTLTLDDLKNYRTEMLKKKLVKNMEIKYLLKHLPDRVAKKSFINQILKFLYWQTRFNLLSKVMK